MGLQHNCVYEEIISESWSPITYWYFDSTICYPNNWILISSMKLYLILGIIRLYLQIRFEKINKTINLQIFSLYSIFKIDLKKYNSGLDLIFNF